MITLIINGYYRSGTTIIGRLFAESNSDLVYIHEPHSPLVLDELKRYSMHSIHPLHGFPIYSGYYKLTREQLETFKQIYKQHDFINDKDTVIRILDFFNALPRKILIKSNQLHTWLDIVIQRYECKVIHVYRNVADTLYNHVYPEYQSNEEYLKKLFIDKNMNYKFIIGFWIDEMYNSVKKRFNLPKIDERDIVEKFIVMYITLNQYAIEKCLETEKCYVLHFNDFVNRTRDYMYYLRYFTGLYINESLMRLIDKEKVRQAPEWLVELVNAKMEKYGLKEPI